jgi:hypothetical protein
MRIAVVLPAPFRPTNPQTEAVGTSKVRPSSATVSPKRLEIPSSASMIGTVTEEPTSHGR